MPTASGFSRAIISSKSAYTAGRDDACGHRLCATRCAFCAVRLCNATISICPMLRSAGICARSAIEPVPEIAILITSSPLASSSRSLSIRAARRRTGVSRAGRAAPLLPVLRSCAVRGLCVLRGGTGLRAFLLGAGFRCRPRPCCAIDRSIELVRPGSHRPPGALLRGLALSIQPACRWRRSRGSGSPNLRADRSSPYLPQQSLPELARGASIFESLAIIYEQHRHFLPIAPFERGVTVYFDAAKFGLEARQLRFDHLLHLVTEFAIAARVERKFDHRRRERNLQSPYFTGGGTTVQAAGELPQWQDTDEPSSQRARWIRYDRDARRAGGDRAIDRCRTTPARASRPALPAARGLAFHRAPAPSPSGFP